MCVFFSFLCECVCVCVRVRAHVAHRVVYVYVRVAGAHEHRRARRRRAQAGARAARTHCGYAMPPDGAPPTAPALASAYSVLRERRPTLEDATVIACAKTGPK